MDLPTPQKQLTIAGMGTGEPYTPKLSEVKQIKLGENTFSFYNQSFEGVRYVHYYVLHQGSYYDFVYNERYIADHKSERDSVELMLGSLVFSK
jgi:hypothetical protein